MPYARRTLYRRPVRSFRKVFRKKVYPRRKMALSRVTKAPRIGNITHRFTRFSDQVYTIAQWNGISWTDTPVSPVLSQLNISGNTEFNPFLFGFRFTDLNNDTEFSSLFRYYALTGVKFTLVFRNNVSEQASLNRLPFVYSSFAPDMDGSDAPTSMQQFRERGNCQRRYITANKTSLSWYFSPRVLGQVLDMDGNTSRSQDYKAKWITFNNVSMVHSGLLINIDNTSGSEYSVAVECQYYFKCKGTQ